MKKPELTHNEAERIAELEALKILDTESERDFDDLTLLASKICLVPIALVSLVDKNRQWFKSKIGLSASETPRAVSFCGHAIHGREIFEVRDSTVDERFSDNPLVTGAPYVRFYAGAPLVTKDGKALGTLCVIDHKPSQLTHDQKEALSALARQVVRLFELRKSTMQITNELEGSKGREREIRKLSEQLIAAQEVAKIGSWEFNLVTQAQTWSLEHYKIFEIDSPQESHLLYKMYRERIHPEDLSRLDALIDRAQRLGEGFSYDHRVFLDGGDRLKHVRGIGRVVKNDVGELVLQGTCQDRSDEVQLGLALEQERAKAVQTAKLASLGEMAAGIAHEINNPLAIVTGTAQTLHKHVGNKEVFAQRIESIVDAGERIAKIVRGLRKFSRSSEGSVRQRHSLKAIVDEVLTLTAAKSRRHEVRIRAHVGDDCEIVCNEIEIAQVLVNLVNNGIDAVKNLDDKWVVVEAMAECDSITIGVKDSGRGLPKSASSRIFQPFFTTKPVGEGTGLGLAIARGIIEEHGGSIELKEREAHTCFEIVLPRSGGLEHAA